MRTLTPLRGRSSQNTVGAVGQCEDGFVDIPSHLAGVDVEGGDDFEIGRAILADAPVHQANGVFRRFVTVVVDSLDQRTRAISDSDDGNPDGAHPLSS